jgi:hypothetical protein
MAETWEWRKTLNKQNLLDEGFMEETIDTFSTSHCFGCGHFPSSCICPRVDSHPDLIYESIRQALHQIEVLRLRNRAHKVLNKADEVSRLSVDDIHDKRSNIRNPIAVLDAVLDALSALTGTEEAN